MSLAEKAFRELRESWFYSKLFSRPHDRIWEDESDEEIRDKYNKSLKEKYDQDTEAILRGEDRIISPHCAASLNKKSQKG
jgi:hypothetical protein